MQDVVACVVLWHVFNTIYTSYNKRVLAHLPLPWMLAAFQLGVGLLYLVVVWGLGIREMPKVTQQQKRKVLHLALLHAGGHALALLSLEVASPQLANFLKAFDPLLVGAVHWMLSGYTEHLVVWLMVVSIICGAALASAAELHWDWQGAAAVAASMTAYALRTAMAKEAPAGLPRGANLAGLVTIMAFLGLVPVALVMEGPRLADAWQDAASQVGEGVLIKELVLSGLSFYLQTEVGFILLDRCRVATYSVCSTMRRSVPLLLGGLVGGSRVPKQSLLGAAWAIGSAALFAATKDRFTLTPEAAGKKSA